MQYLLTDAELTDFQSRPKRETLKSSEEATGKLRAALLAATNTRCVKDRFGPGISAVHCDGCPVGKMIVESNFADKQLCPKADDWSQ